MATPRKKKIAQRHDKAITAYKEWLEKNSDASRKRRMKQFDAFMDSAILNEQLKDGVEIAQEMARAVVKGKSR